MGRHNRLCGGNPGEGPSRRGDRDRGSAQDAHARPEAIVLRAYGQRSEDLQSGHQQGADTDEDFRRADVTVDGWNRRYGAVSKDSRVSFLDQLAVSFPIRQL
uniref:(northern house mosquito) hypothetical protein n=1 Tax=Culex pipiens TaxID=7175 RepID=A0A8D8CMZ5_CULPI